MEPAERDGSPAPEPGPTYRRVPGLGTAASQISMQSSASLPALGGRSVGLKSQSPLGPTVSDRISEIALGLSDRSPKTRQRVFAAHATDAKHLQQMVSVLTARAGRTSNRDRGIQNAGLIEEGQLYAVCMQELASQLSVHSPVLSDLAGQLFHGFISFFQRSLKAEEFRLEREREAHHATRVQLRAATSETEHWRAHKDEVDRKLNAEQRKMQDKERLVAQLEKRVYDATGEVQRMRQQLEQHLGVSAGKDKKKKRMLIRAAEGASSGQEAGRVDAQGAPGTGRAAGAAGGGGAGGARGAGATGGAHDGEEGDEEDGERKGGAGHGAGQGATGANDGEAAAPDGDGGGKKMMTFKEEVMGSALEAMGTNEAGIEHHDLEADAEESEAETRKKTMRMLGHASETMRARVADINEFLRGAASDAEITGRAADHLRRMVRTVGAVDYDALSAKSDKTREAEVQTEDYLEGNPNVVRKKQRRRSVRRGSLSGSGPQDGAVDAEPPMERLLRLSRMGKLRLEGGVDSKILPPRIASRTVMQLMLDKASRGQSESLPEFTYNFYLHMYGVKRLAEQNLSSLLLSCAMHGAAYPRLGTFCKVCGVLEEPPSHADADTELVCNMYAELNAVIHAYNKTLTGGPATIAAHRLETGDDGEGMMCLKAQCVDKVQQLFAHINSLHTETYGEIIASIDDLVSTRGKGKDLKEIVDVDRLVAETLARWHAGRYALREQVSALFSAGDVNNDGVLSFDEFTQIVKLVLPAATPDRIWATFRDCVEASGTDGEGDGSGGGGGGGGVDAANGLPEGGGITAEVFVSVVETHGLLGACLSAEGLASAQESLGSLKAPITGSSRNLLAQKQAQQQGGGQQQPQQPQPSTTAATDGAAVERRRSGPGSQPDEHDKLRMEHLVFEWNETVASLEAKIAKLDVVLSDLTSVVHAELAEEREQMAKELETIPQQLEKLSVLIRPPTGKPISPEDTHFGWVQYRHLLLKLSRLEARVTFLAKSAAGDASAEDDASQAESK